MGGQVNAASLRAMASGGTKVSSGSYNEGSTGPVSVMQKSGAIFWVSGMSIDCDGQPGSKCNINTDPYFQPDTSYHQSDGKALKAEDLPYIVVPLPSSIWNAANHGIVGGNLCTLIYGDKYIHAVVGDQGPPERVGEASYAAASALGIPPSPTSGGVESKVTYIVYPGVKVTPIESKAEAARLGELKAAEWLGVTNVASNTYTVKAGDTFSSIAASTNVSVDKLSTLNNLLVVGHNLEVTLPAPPPVTEKKLPAGTWVWFDNVGKTETNNSNLVVQQALAFESNYDYSSGPGIFGPHTQEAYRQWQMSLGFTGTDADGLPGKTSLEALAKKYGFEVRYRTVTPSPVAPSTTPASKISPHQVLFTGRTDAGEGRAFCEDAIRKGLAIMGLPVTQAWINGYLTIAVRESAYNAKQWRVNGTDSNAINPAGYSNGSDGYPFQCSRGAWQCIPQTFAEYHQAGTSLSIYDAVANFCASANYVRHTYHVSNDGSNLASNVQQADPNRPPRGY